MKTCCARILTVLQSRDPLCRTLGCDMYVSPCRLNACEDGMIMDQHVR